MDELAHFLALQRRLLERRSTQVEPFEHGAAFFDDGYRERYISNLLLADAGVSDVHAQDLARIADEILGGAGFEHRLVVVTNDRQGARLAPGFREQGYSAARSLVLTHRRDPDRATDVDADECSFADSRSLTEEIYRREALVPPTLIPRFADQHENWERVIGARRFVARIDGVLAGQCELYVDGSEAQVEFVDTLEEFRGRGVARSVVLAAVAAARASGAHHVFIEADDDDWPKELYGRLGFDVLAGQWELSRWPAPVEDR
jgi:ribosomal protein S18 acetylase RimI-like enzyme